MENNPRHQAQEEHKREENEVGSSGDDEGQPLVVPQTDGFLATQDDDDDNVPLMGGMDEPAGKGLLGDSSDDEPLLIDENTRKAIEEEM